MYNFCKALKMNSNTLSPAYDFLGFLMQNRGIEFDGNKAKAIQETSPPSKTSKLQSLLEKKLISF